MLSRIADSLFWLNRYMERSEGLLRIYHTHYILSFDAGATNSASWAPLLNLFATTAIPNERAGLEHLLAGANNLNSIRNLISKARENARGIQDNITKEVWEHVNQMHHWMQEPEFERQLQENNLLPLVEATLEKSILFVGLTDTTMPRGTGWSFMNLGRFTERCLLTTQMALQQFERIDFDLQREQDILFWRYLLFSLSGYEHHLKTYRSSDSTGNIVDQLVLDENFPRSVKYTLNRMEKYLKDVVQPDAGASSEAEELYLEFSRFNSQVQFADMNYIRRHGLQRFLQQVQQDVLRTANRLGQVFFSYS